jgi:cyclohexanone monooxygenase
MTQAVGTATRDDAGVADGTQDTEYDAVIVGAGWAGLYMLHRLREAGYRARLLEAGSGVGGTWFWNRYPGARCDLHSVAYSYSFSEDLQQDWEWPELYSTQADIERYANHVADRFDLWPDISLSTRVRAADYDEAAHRWRITTASGEQLNAAYCIMATGGFSIPAKPDIAGIDSFAGDVYYTQQWPHTKIDFEGKRVGVVGTGSSGTQTITAVGAEPVEHLYVFQRTANYAVPGWNRVADPEFTRATKSHYREYRDLSRSSGNGTLYPPALGTLTIGPFAGLSEEEFQQRMQELWDCGGAYIVSAIADLLTDEQVNARVAEYLRAHLRKVVHDPTTAALLTPPESHYVAARRIIVENGYFDTYNKPNVSLVDIKTNPIVEVTPKGIRTTSGEYDLDILIFATGFDSGTGAMLNVDFTGTGGQALRDKWADGPRTYLGLMAEGFPNMFMIAQAGSPSIRSAVMVSIEQHVEWIMNLLAKAGEAGVLEIEPTVEAEDAWTDHVADLADGSLATRHESQYIGANIPGKPRVYLAYLGGTGPYAKICADVVDNDYEGFVLRTQEGDLPAKREWSGPGANARIYGSVI